MWVAICRELFPNCHYYHLFDFYHTESTLLTVVDWAPVGRVGKNHFQAWIDEADAVAVDSCTYHDLERIDSLKYNGGGMSLPISLYLPMGLALKLMFELIVNIVIRFI